MILTGLPFGLEESDQIPARAASLCVQPFHDLPACRRIHMKISFPRGTEYETFRLETEIGWKAGHFRESWEEYHYTSKLLRILKDYSFKLKRCLCGLSPMEET